VARVEISKRLVLVNSASSAVTTVLNLSVLVWLQQYLLKRISAEEYSLVPLMAAIMAFGPLLSMVLTGGLGRFVTVAYARGDDDEVTRICSTMLPILAAGGMAFLAVGWTCAWYIDHLIRIDPGRLWDSRVMMGLLVFSAALQLPAAAFGSGFIVRQKLVLQDLVSMSCQLLRFLVLFSLLFGVSTRVLWVIVASVTSDLANLAVTIPVSIRLLPAQRFRWNAIRWSLAREIIKYGGWTLANQIAQTARMAMDPLILNRFASAFDVATFNVAGIVPRQLPLLVGPLSRPFIPLLAAMHATGDYTRLRNTYLRTARYHAWVLLAVATPAIIFNKELMLLYLGGKYQGAGTVMAVLLVVPILNAFNAMGPAALAAVGVMRGLASRQLIVHSANLLLTVFFVAQLGKGAFGSAAATLLATLAFDTTLTWRLSWRTTHTSGSAWVREVLLPTLVPALPSILICLSVKYLFGIKTWIGLFAVSAVSAALNLVLIAAFGLRNQDRIDIARIADRLPGPAKNLAHRLGTVRGN
jgi:O-antigen/teichoic acid export membrane protein